MGGVLTVASSVSERGELTLLRRADGALELRVNGLFAMDTAETASERMLASAAIEAAAPDNAVEGGSRLRVLVGGLGLGFTVDALLADPRVEQIVVAEIEPDLVRWHETGIVPPPARPATTDKLLDDPPVAVVVADVRDVVAGQDDDAYDLVLLDVDNGPGFLLYADNAPIYRQPFLAACAATLRLGGVAAVWSASESVALAEAMDAVFATTDVHAIPVTLNNRRTHYHLYIGRTGPAEGGSRAG
jgi:spermidine synthase